MSLRTVRIRYTAYPDTAPEPVGSRLDPVLEWAAENHRRVALILVALILFVGRFDWVPL